jgi:CPA1 family monovalent cation:H+ antiporter
LRDEGTVEQEIWIARAELARAALRTLEDQDPRPDVLVSEYQARLRAAESRAPLDADERDDASLAALQRRIVEVQREALTDLRARHVIGDDALHAVEEEIDLLELTADSRVRSVPM